MTSNSIPARTSGKFFHLGSASGGGTLVTEDDVPCYCAGTRIAIAHGEVRVEELAIGDEVLTRSGALRPIKSIAAQLLGHFAHGAHVLPICFKAGCLGPEQPRRDLWVSPNHAMFLEGVLIEARDLINGASIIQAERVERVDYFHLELDTHDIIIAEGAWSESFVDDDSRAIFQNAHAYAALYPDGRASPAQYCAPRGCIWPGAGKARKRLAERAGIPYAQPSSTRGPRALVIDSRVPEIGHDGGANAILDHMRALQAAGFEVNFLALDAQGRDTNVRALRALGVVLLSRLCKRIVQRFCACTCWRVRSRLFAPGGKCDPPSEGGAPLFRCVDHLQRRRPASSSVESTERIGAPSHI